jgi:adenylate cyclase
VWSERYDREAKDIFDLQDEITLKIGQAMKFELTEKEQEQSYAKWKTKNLIAFEKNYQGVGYARRATKQDNDMARRMYEEALSADPNYLLAKLNLAWTYFQDARMGWSESPVESTEEAYRLAQEILTADDSNDPAYTLLAAIYLVKRQHDKAIEAAERAVAINPNGAVAYLTLGGIVGCTGKWEDSVLYIKKAIRLNPFPQLVNYWFLGRALFMLGQYDESVATLKMALELNPDYLPAHIFLAANYSSTGRHSEADASAREILRINPRFTIDSHARTIPYKYGADVERELAALRSAGLK